MCIFKIFYLYNIVSSLLGSIEVSAVCSNYIFWAQKPAVINNFKLQLAVIKKILICSLQ